MAFPSFFQQLPVIECCDPLASLLGAATEGEMTYTYEDCVKCAGHSCPTVAGAYLMTLHALKYLYDDEKAIRGQIRVDLRDPLDEGVTGVIAMVVGLITGAAGPGGFKGIGGKFKRAELLHFDADISSELRFTRLDTGESVGVDFNASPILPDQRMGGLLQTILQGEGSAEVISQFGTIWQDRVERILTSQEMWPEMIRLS